MFMRLHHAESVWFGIPVVQQYSGIPVLYHAPTSQLTYFNSISTSHRAKLSAEVISSISSQTILIEILYELTHV